MMRVTAPWLYAIEGGLPTTRVLIGNHKLWRTISTWSLDGPIASTAVAGSWPVNCGPVPTDATRQTARLESSDWF